MTPEHRAGCEFRVAGRTLSGVAMRYGDTSPDFRERFVPGAFGTVPATLPVNLQHDSSIVVAERAVLADTPRELRVRAELPEGSAALKLVRRARSTASASSSGRAGSGARRESASSSVPSSPALRWWTAARIRAQPRKCGRGPGGVYGRAFPTINCLRASAFPNPGRAAVARAFRWRGSPRWPVTKWPR